MSITTAGRVCASLDMVERKRAQFSRSRTRRRRARARVAARLDANIVARARVVTRARATERDDRARDRTTRRAMFRNVERLRAALAKMPDAARASVNPANGRFRAPEFSGRVVAELRKAAIANGYEWTHDKPRGTQKTLTRPGKGHKCDREKPAREAARAEALAKQPELIAAYRARMRSKAKGLDKTWDDFVLTKSEKTLKIRMQDQQGGKK